jgi:hypothetical protein
MVNIINRLKTSENSDFTKAGIGGKASWGLWSVGGSFDHEDSHKSTSKDTSEMEVSFKYARVDIVRPWLNLLLFSAGGWDMGDAFKQGGLSDGTKSQANPFPLLTTSFIAVRDVSIKAGGRRIQPDQSKTASAGRLGAVFLVAHIAQGNPTRISTRSGTV